MAIDENQLAREITKHEGLKKALTIADVKEVLRLTLLELARRRPSEVLALLERRGLGDRK